MRSRQSGPDAAGVRPQHGPWRVGGSAHLAAIPDVDATVGAGLGDLVWQKVNRILSSPSGYVSTAAEHGQTLRDLSQMDSVQLHIV